MTFSDEQQRIVVFKLRSPGVITLFRGLYGHFYTQIRIDISHPFCPLLPEKTPKTPAGCFYFNFIVAFVSPTQISFEM